MGGRGAVPGADRDPLTRRGNGIVDKAVICRSQTHAAAATCHRARRRRLLRSERDRRPSDLQPNPPQRIALEFLPPNAFFWLGLSILLKFQ